ncbi:MAG TPA: hypothetical protein VGO22_04210 [Pseudorhizobium sp.]|jgi:hypothetical protein|nr:hypothetical protein [Pseudorhizobium sp.]
MIRRLLDRSRDHLFGPPAEIRQEAKVLSVLLGPEKAWHRANGKRRLAEVADAEDAHRYWSRVMREIERQTGHAHHPNKATRYLER